MFGLFTGTQDFDVKMCYILFFPAGLNKFVFYTFNSKSGATNLWRMKIIFSTHGSLEFMMTLKRLSFSKLEPPN